MENKEAVTIAKALVDNVILVYGSFKTIKSDLGTEFINQIFQNICKYLRINHITSTAFHHETLGSIERSHRVLNEYLLCFTDNNFEWYEWIKYFVFSYNITPNVDTGYTPFELIFGKLASIPSDITEPLLPIYNFEDYTN